MKFSKSTGSSRTRRSVLAVLCIAAAAPASAITIPTMPVGNAGNAADARNGYGAVAYNYRIGATEVTIGQYVAFLNAVARTDTYGLYNPSMATDPNIAGVARSGVSGSYSYSAIGSTIKPIAYVSWGDAARFANWLQNGQPTGAEGPGTTETGAYTLNGAVTDAALNAVTRNSGATWFLPSENEWYKAAYHKNDGATGNYWNYPMSTNSFPYSDQPPGATSPDNTRVGNFRSDDGLANGYNDGYAVTGAPSLDSFQNYLTNVTAYSFSRSPYGTWDQGGNVSEWDETLIDRSYRGLRGGSWYWDFGRLLFDYRDAQLPTQEDSIWGFRVATVPEPSALTMAALGAAALGTARLFAVQRRRRAPGFRHKHRWPTSKEVFGQSAVNHSVYDA